MWLAAKTRFPALAGADALRGRIGYRERCGVARRTLRPFRHGQRREPAPARTPVPADPAGIRDGPAGVSPAGPLDV